MSVDFEMTFCYPGILPKNERNYLIIAVLLGLKKEFLCSFFGRIVGLKITLPLCLTFRGDSKTPLALLRLNMF